MVRCNTLTICSTKTPEYYLRLIRFHFKQSGDTPAEKNLTIQALGQSAQNLVYVACLVTMKGYANYKRIKNDHLSVPVADATTGVHLGLVKKVRLTVKLVRAENFDKIIEEEVKPPKSNISSLMQAGAPSQQYQPHFAPMQQMEPMRQKKPSSDSATGEHFDPEDMVLKSN